MFWKWLLKKIGQRFTGSQRFEYARGVNAVFRHFIAEPVRLFPWVYLRSLRISDIAHIWISNHLDRLPVVVADDRGQDCACLEPFKSPDDGPKHVALISRPLDHWTLENRVYKKRKIWEFFCIYHLACGKAMIHFLFCREVNTEMKNV